MALGGGNWIVQNKELPGAYINFVSLASASATLSDRGIATMPLELDWGVENEVFTVTNEDFQKDSLRIFGYPYTDDHLKGLRDLFMNANTLHAYRLNGGGDKASNDYADAKYSGVRGNDLKIVIRANVDNPEMWDVLTYLGTIKVDEQTVKEVKDLVENDYVKFKGEFTLEAKAGEALQGGTTKSLTGEEWQGYADKIESYTFNTMGIVSKDATVLKLFNAFTKRLRDEQGIKFQLVTYNNAADYMGVINVKNKTTDSDWPEASLVYWMTGVQCACPVQSSCEARKYDGEFTVAADYTQSELKAAIKAGELVLHRVNSDIEILVDINSMVTTAENCGDIFKENQTIRVIDQLGNDDAVLFNTKYRGQIPNNDAGRTALWSDLVKLRKELQDLGAIEDFSDTDVAVAQGETKKSVVVQNQITVVNAMSKMYMTTTVA